VTPILAQFSQQIERLEENLRVTLIKKTRRGVELTAEGTGIQSEVKKFLPRINALKTKSGPRD